MALLLLLAIASQLLMQFMISLQRHDSHVINVAGRQRMLSQNLAKTAMYMADAESPAIAKKFRGQLAETAILWQRSQAGLLHGDEGMQLPGGNSAAILELYRGLEPSAQAIGAAVDDILRHPDDAATIAAAVKLIRQHEPAYLVRMDEIASHYEREAMDKVKTARWISTGLAALLLTVVMLQGLLVFAPANRRIGEDLERLASRERELARHHQELEGLVARRTQQLEERAQAMEEAAAKVRDLQQRLSDVFVATSHGLLLADADGSILMLNPAMEALFGYRQDELLGQPVEILLPEVRREEHINLREGFVRSGEAATHPTGVLQARHRSGAPVPIDLTLRRWQTATESLVLATVVDMTERLRYEADLRHASQLAEEANRAKSQFLANMSHEIRTPMNAILGFASLMRRDGVTPLQAERLDKIDKATQHLLGIINDILDLSKIESGKLVLEQTDVAIDAIVANVASMIFDRVQARDVELVIDVEAMPHLFTGDPTRLQQALLNFATNAVKFTEKGSIILRTRVVEQTDSDALLRFEVEDSGIGIAPDALGRLFNMFEQADNSTTRRYGGTGLGLAITKRLVLLMGGETGVDSVPGVGSRFWFTARLDKAGAAADAVDSQSGAELESRLAQVCAGRRILVADDDALNQEVVCGLLADIGVSVDTASDGLEALAMAQAQPYALILMDMQMPMVDGVEATRRIRRGEKAGAVPILAMTANVFGEDKARCLEAGMNDFISKPFNAEGLFALMLKWLADADEKPLRRSRDQRQIPEEAVEADFVPLQVLDAAVAAAVADVEALLNDNDVSARRVLQENATLLRRAIGDKALATLERQIAGFDFATAAATLEALRGNYPRG